MLAGGEVHHAKHPWLKVADAFENARNEWYRPTRWFGATVEITEVDAKPKRVGSSLHDDRVTVVHCIRRRIRFCEGESPRGPCRSQSIPEVEQALGSLLSPTASGQPRSQKV